MTVFTGKVEIGQNIRTSLAQTVADELRVPLDVMVSMVMADTDLTPFDQGTFGSQTTPRMAPILARAAATAREMLIDEAAAVRKVDRGTLMVRDGTIFDVAGAVVTRSGDMVTTTIRALSYGELMKGKALQGIVPANAAEKETPRDHWTLRRTTVAQSTAPALVTGHQYAPHLDRRPCRTMKSCRIVRPPAYGATPRAVDDAKARVMAGVTVVRDGNFIGVGGAESIGRDAGGRRDRHPVGSAHRPAVV